MAEEKRLPLIWRIHNATCPAWLLGISSLMKLEPGCKEMHKRLGGEWGKEQKG